MNNHSTRPERGEDDAHLSESEMRCAFELLFFAYRDFTAEPDAILARFGFGRAHHRVIYFVKANPGITVNRLLDILKITKQSLSRVLGQLVRENFIAQQTDAVDRRRRMLTLTAKGEDLERELTDSQSRLVSQAYQMAGADAVRGFKRVLRAMVNDEDRGRFAPIP